MKTSLHSKKFTSIILLLLFLAACSQPNPLDELEAWDLVYISDSTGFGVPDKLAANIERDTGKQVVVHNWLQGGLPALRVLEQLHAEPWIRNLSEDISEAEMIIVFANPRGDPGQGGINRGGIETCMNASACKKPDNCTAEFYKPYVENLKTIYAEIFALRAGQATIIRAVDLYNPIISEHRDCGTEEVCAKCWETFNAAVHQAAEAYQVPVVSVHDLFNGPTHIEDPRTKGYIGPDGEHTTETGQQAIADLLSQAGYMPLIP
jgi:hypothetical protein